MSLMQATVTGVQKGIVVEILVCQNKIICPIHFSFGFVIIPVMNVRIKNFFISSTVMGTQVGYKAYPVKGYCAAFMA
jgi:hypothetical protein